MFESQEAAPRSTAAGVLTLAACLAFAGPTHAQDECCTDHLACQDGRWCTGIEYCNCWGVCISGTRPNCEDGNPCTVDNCIDDVIDPPGAGYGSGHCEHVDICGGCTVAADCDDGNLCTTDQCIGGSCVNSWQTGCCITNADCDDGDICTDDTCSGNVCSNTYIPGCCHNDGDCDDTDPCTQDVCDSSNTCENTPIADCCVTDADCDDGDNCTEHTCDTVSNECQLIWSGTPPWDCCNEDADCDNDLDCDGWETCDDSTVSRGQCVDAPDMDCDDGFDCTTDSCDETATWCATPPDFCLCSHEMPPSPLYDDCSSAGPMTASGIGDNMEWTASGDTHCSNDDYAPSCTSGGIDNVHSLDIPTDGATNHQLYEYHVMVSAPEMDPTVSLFPADTCGGSFQWGCNVTSLGSCWSGTGHAAADSNDACFDEYAWSSASSVLPEGSYSVLVDSSDASGGNYDLFVTREAFNNSGCGSEVEIQMGGKWYGNTFGAHTYGCAFCSQDPVSGSGGSCSDYDCNEDYAQVEFEIDHTSAEWASPSGYVITADAVGAFDPALSLFKHTCYSNMSTNLGQVYGVACNNDMDSSTGAHLVTGVIPAFYVGSVRLHGYSAGMVGEYELTVEPDVDGDGLGDDVDVWPGQLWGATPDVGGGLTDGPITIDTVPYSDTRTNYDYPNDLLEGCRMWFLVCMDWSGRDAPEVYYKLDVAGSVDVTVAPFAHGDVFTHADIPGGWDPVLWYSDDCSNWDFVDSNGESQSEEVNGVSGNGCLAVDGYKGEDAGYFILEVE